MDTQQPRLIYRRPPQHMWTYKLFSFLFFFQRPPLIFSLGVSKKKFYLRYFAFWKKMFTSRE